MFRAQAAAKFEAEGCARNRAVAGCFDRNETEIFDPADHIGGGSRGQGATDDFAASSESPVSEVRHGLPNRGDAQDFGYRSYPGPALRRCVSIHGGHSVLNRDTFNLARIAMRADK